MWAESNRILKIYWDLFRTEYLNFLRERSSAFRQKAGNTQLIPKLDEIVMVKTDNVKNKLLWPLARVTHLSEGEDKQARIATVKMANGKVRQRPIHHLYPLELNDYDKPLSGSRQMVLAALLLLAAPTFVEGRGERPCTSPPEKLERFDAQDCRPNGFVIYTNTTYNEHRFAVRELCYVEHECDFGHLRRDADLHKRRKTCGLECRCPEWALDCSHYKGMSGSEQQQRNRHNTIDVIDSLKSELLPWVCGIEQSSKCPFPVNIKLYTVELLDGSQWTVNALHLSHEQYHEGDLRCLYGYNFTTQGYNNLNGTITGTPEVCEVYSCNSSSKNFCWKPHVDRVYLNSPVGKVQIQAWGTVDTHVYVHNRSISAAYNSESFRLKCHDHGVEVYADEMMSKLELCVEEHCIWLSGNITIPINVSFPHHRLEHDHVVTAYVWKNHHKVVEHSEFCEAVDFCKIHSCLFCYKMIECVTPVTVIAFISLFYMTAACTVLGSTRLIFRLLSNRYSTVKQYAVTDLTFSKTVNAECCETSFGGNSERISASVPGKSRSGGPPLRRTLPTTEMPPLRITIGLVATIIAVSLPRANACTKTASITVPDTRCYRNESGLICQFEHNTRLPVVGNNSEFCFLMNHEKQSTFGSVRIWPQPLNLRCSKEDVRFSRPHNFRVNSIKRCANSGSCEGMQCSLTNDTSIIPELGAVPHSYPSIAYYKDSCGCAGCFCFYCGTGCLFIRIYSQPTSTDVQEIYKCSWDPVLPLKIEITEGHKQRTYFSFVSYDKSYSDSELEISLISASYGPFEQLNSDFIDNRMHAAIVKHTINPTLKCDDARSARYMECRMPYNPCSCEEANSMAVCRCPSIDDYTVALDRHDLQLPLYDGNLKFEFVNRTIIAKTLHGLSELQLTFKNITLQQLSDESTCEMKHINLKGCHNCGLKSTLTYRCATNFGSVVAHASCTHVSFPVRCDENGTAQTQKIAFDHHIVSESCVLTCPRSKTNFKLRAYLKGADSYAQLLDTQYGGWASFPLEIPNILSLIWKSFFIGHLKFWAFFSIFCWLALSIGLIIALKFFKLMPCFMFVLVINIHFRPSMADLREPEGADHIPADIEKLTEAEEKYLAGEPTIEQNGPPQPAEAEPENAVADDDILSEAGDEGANPAPEPAPNVTYADQLSDTDCNARWRRGRFYTWPEVSTGPGMQSRRTLLQLVDELVTSLGYDDLDALLSEPKGRGTINPYLPKLHVFVPEMRMWIEPVRMAPQKATTYIMAPKSKPPYNRTELSLDDIYKKKGMALRQPQLNLVYCGIWGNWPLERLFVGQGAKLERSQQAINQAVSSIRKEYKTEKYLKTVENPKNPEISNQPNNAVNGVRKVQYSNNLRVQVQDKPSTSGTQRPAPRPPPTSVRCNECGNRVQIPRSA